MIYVAYALFALSGAGIALMVFVIAFGPWLAQRFPNFVQEVSDASYADPWW